MVCDVKVIGIGSPFGADQVGLQVIDQLMEELDSGLVKLAQLDRPGVLLLEHMKDSAEVYLVDAMCSGLKPGSVRKFTLEEVIESDVLLSSHGFGVQQSLSLGKAMGELPPKIVLFGIEVSTSLEQDNEIGPGVEEAASQIRDELLARFGPLVSKSESALQRQ